MFEPTHAALQDAFRIFFATAVMLSVIINFKAQRMSSSTTSSL